MPVDQTYISTMNQSIKKLVGGAVKLSLKKPAFGKFVLKNLAWQSKAEAIREHYEAEGFHIPPFLIASITTRCNLRCKGCYAMKNQNPHLAELSSERWFETFKEAKELGISFILLAGGEPMMRRDLLEKVGQIPEIIFPLFTNGTLMDASYIHLLEKNRNLIPIISMEGLEKETDDRRGLGVHQKAMDVMQMLQENDLFFGTSITVTSKNFELVTSEAFVKDLVEGGCKLFFYVEYVPFEENTKDLEITKEQRLALLGLLENLRQETSALFIAFPGDESKMGGCLSSGRGFVHINPAGELEPCPFSPYSDISLKDHSLKVALQSEFLKRIRESDVHLSETENGCALFNKQSWVQSLIAVNHNIPS